MKKKIISTVLCGLLAVTMLAGCGNNTEADTTAEEQVTEETEEASEEE